MDTSYEATMVAFQFVNSIPTNCRLGHSKVVRGIGQ